MVGALVGVRSEQRTPFLARVSLPGILARVSLPGIPTRYVKYADAKLVPLPPVAAEAAVQSGVFDADDVYLLIRIVRELHVHNNEVSYISSIRLSPASLHADAIIVATKELDQRQKTIEKWCEELIEFLREQEGIVVKIPPEPKEDDGGSSEELPSSASENSREGQPAP
jgi:hypothetical protein